MIIRFCAENDRENWDAYAGAHPNASCYHLSAWGAVIRKAYSHTTYYLLAIDNITSSDNGHVIGILPLIHMKHFLFGNTLVSMPFFDMGGMIAEDEEIERALLSKALDLAKGLEVTSIELRNTQAIRWLQSRETQSPESAVSLCMDYFAETRSHKVRMIMDLPESSASLMSSFKSKLRSQIRVPLKEGLESRIGGVELLDDFYQVFLINMRDLGSPVHSRRLIKLAMDEFPDKAKIVVVYKGSQPVASSVIVGFRDILHNPWASSLRQYSRLSPNMLLYWTMLEYGCDNGYKRFDFGRSSPEEGTYRFKEQWGAKPQPLYWQYIGLKGLASGIGTTEKSRYETAVRYWQKLPVSVTRILGPKIRKHIGL